MEGADSPMEDWTYQVIQSNFLLETQKLLLLPSCTGVSPALRLVQRADDVDVFRRRWVDIISGSLKRSDGAADRVRTIDNRQ